MVCEAEARRKVLKDCGREKKGEGRKREEREEREKERRGRLVWSPGVWVDRLWKLLEKIVQILFGSW